MSPMNTTRAYGWAARAFHWTVAVLILVALGLGLYAGSLPSGSDDELQAVFAAFSIHKTAGVAVLIIALARILWTLSQIRPRPLYPERRLETLLAETVHWALWIGMIVMPLSGWLLHSAAPGGFSRILWPFGQRLPLVPQDAALAEGFARFHETGWWVLAGLILLHVAGALKHALIDRDHTLGHAYFMGIKSFGDLEHCLLRKVIPLLQEYFFDDFSRVALVLSTSAEEPFLQEETLRFTRLFSGEKTNDVPTETARFLVTPPHTWTAESFRGIYGDLGSPEATT